MTLVNHLASLLEALKFSHPKYFALVQTLLFGLFIALETHPEFALEYVSQNIIDYAIFVLVGLGFSVSSSTTDYLSPNHKKVMEIGQRNTGELDLEQYKI